MTTETWEVLGIAY